MNHSRAAMTAAKGGVRLTKLLNHLAQFGSPLGNGLLQLIRILKNYDLFKEPQLELFKAKRKKR